MQRRKFLSGMLAAGAVPGRIGRRPPKPPIPERVPQDVVPVPIPGRRPYVCTCGDPHDLAHLFDGRLTWYWDTEPCAPEESPLGHVWVWKARRMRECEDWTYHHADDRSIEFIRQRYAGMAVPPCYVLIGNEPLNGRETDQSDPAEMGRWYAEGYRAIKEATHGRTQVGAPGLCHMRADWWHGFVEYLDWEESRLDLIHLHAYDGQGDVEYMVQMIRDEAGMWACYDRTTPIWCSEVGHLAAKTYDEAIAYMQEFLSWAPAYFQAMFWFITRDTTWAHQAPGTFLIDESGELTPTGEAWAAYRAR